MTKNTKHKKNTKNIKNTKTRFNLFKLIRNVGILVIIIIALTWVLNALFTPTPKSLPKVVNPPVKKVTTPAPASVNPTAEYKAKQYKIFTSIFRFNQNLYMLMSGNNVVNLYPDSQNAVTALNDNLSAYASKLNSTDVRNESIFLNELTLKNNAFINAIIAYNKEALSKNPNQETLNNLHATAQQAYNDINKFMNDNLSIFK